MKIVNFFGTSLHKIKREFLDRLNNSGLDDNFFSKCYLMICRWRYCVISWGGAIRKFQFI